MKDFEVITLQQETGYRYYLEYCEEVYEEPSARDFIRFYTYWCFEEGLYGDLASFQYHEHKEEDEEDEEDEEEEEDKEEEEEEEEEKEKHELCESFWQDLFSESFWQDL